MQQSILRIVFAYLLMVFTQGASAQQFPLGDFQLPPGLGVGGIPDPGIQVSSEVTTWQGSNLGLLTIEVNLNPGWKIYSLTQKSGGPTPTKVHLDHSNRFRLLGTFAPASAPKVEMNDVFGMDVESFEGTVRWTVPIEIVQPGADFQVSGYVEGLTCADQCVPVDEAKTRFSAKVTSSSAGLFQRMKVPGTHTQVLAWLSDRQVAAGDSLQCFFAFQPEPNWHVYAYAKLPPSMFQKPTLVQASLPAGWKSGDIRSSAQILSKKALIDGEPPVREYVGPVTIALPVKVPKSATPGTYSVAGQVGLQTCSKQGCDMPTGFQWNAQVVVDKEAATGFTPTAMMIGEPVKYDHVVSLLQPTVGAAIPSDSAVAATNDSLAAWDVSQIKLLPTAATSTNLRSALLYAFLGGLVLNFMPCVLPVIGLKILSFVEQSGADRGKILRLNVAYVVGMLCVFWVLAVLAAAPVLGLSQQEIGWGEQFNSQVFNIALVSIVFSMALSFLGVWEIPIPGFATSSTATELSSRGGLSGAFFKGAITTLLATPCGAPGLVTAYAFAVNSGSTTLPFLVFSVMGLGMGLPYLIIGAFPSLIRLLPKPGAWMDTFKQLMGFVLLGTVILLLQNLSMTFVLPTVGFLFGLWLACWWIGRVPMTAPRDQRLRAWGVAAIMSLLAIVVCFGNQGLVRHANRKLTLTVDRAVGERMLAMESNAPADAAAKNDAGHDELPWEAFQKDSLNQMIQSGQTVMIDFTADWCQTCRALESFVLNTQPVRDAVQDNQVRTVVADWGTKDPQIGSLLEQLQGSRQIPFLAIFPAGRPQEVMRFSGPYTQATILEALQRAGGGTVPAVDVAGVTEQPLPAVTTRTPQRIARQPVRLQQLP